MYSCVIKTTPQFNQVMRLTEKSVDLVAGSIKHYSDRFNTTIFPTVEHLLVGNESTKNSLQKELGVKIDQNGIFSTKNEVDIVQNNLIHRDLIIEKEVQGTYNNYYKVKNKTHINNSKLDLMSVLETNMSYPKLPKDYIKNMYLNNLRERFGIEVVELSEEESQQEFGRSDIKGAVKDNTIFINTKWSSDQVRLHEMLHLMISPIKLLNPEVYSILMQVALNSKEANKIAEKYNHLTQYDIAEEILVEQLSNYLTGNISEESKQFLEDNELNLFLYELGYLLDSTLDTSMAITLRGFKSLAGQTLSDVFMTHNDTTIPEHFNYLKVGKQSRLIGNIKSDLMKSGELIEKCS